jgi:hypothetical protein
MTTRSNRLAQRKRPPDGLALRRPGHRTPTGSGDPTSMPKPVGPRCSLVRCKGSSGSILLTDRVIGRWCNTVAMDVVDRVALGAG